MNPGRNRLHALERVGGLCYCLPMETTPNQTPRPCYNLDCARADGREFPCTCNEQVPAQPARFDPANFTDPFDFTDIPCTDERSGR